MPPKKDLHWAIKRIIETGTAQNEQFDRLEELTQEFDAMGETVDQHEEDITAINDRIDDAENRLGSVLRQLGRVGGEEQARAIENIIENGVKLRSLMDNAFNLTNQRITELHEYLNGLKSSFLQHMLYVGTLQMITPGWFVPARMGEVEGNLQRLVAMSDRLAKEIINEIAIDPAFYYYDVSPEDLLRSLEKIVGKIVKLEEQNQANFRDVLNRKTGKAFTLRDLIGDNHFVFEDGSIN